MSSKKWVRYTRADGERMAADRVATKCCWSDLDVMRESGAFPSADDEYRVTVERVEPEPEKKWWISTWGKGDGYSSRTTSLPVGESWVSTEYVNGLLGKAVAAIHSATEPTLSEFAAAVKEATGVEIPVPEEEQPKWWLWNKKLGWKPASNHYPWVSDGAVNLYGTVSDRDSKRDALLEAARKAGK